MRIAAILGLSLLLGSICHAAPPDPVRNEALREWNAMKFGLFIHWGIYSVPAGVWDGKEIEKLGEQIQRHAKIPHDEYAELAEQFNPVRFDADAIAALAKKAGMRYVVLTAKHHDGFCMFDSAYTDFDIMDATPYKKDILKQLAEACENHGLKLGVYYSTPDWRFNGPQPEINPDDDKISVFSKVSKANEDYQVAQLKEIMTNYGDIVELFFDMGEPTHDQSKRFANTVRSLQPTCMINGRVMNNQGDFITMPDNHLPDVPLTEWPWESPGTFYHTWGYKSWVKGDPLEEQVPAQIRKLVTIAARGGNFLLNIGPMSDGTVVPYERDVLNGIAEWTAKHGESVFGTDVTPFANLEWGECTTGDNRLYLHVLHWPEDGKIVVPGLRNKVTAVYPLLTPEQELDYSQGSISLEGVAQDPSDTVIVLEYENGLQVEPIRSEPKRNGTLVLEGGNAIHHGKYGRESYRSILPDYYRTWDIGAMDAGSYQVSLVYKLRAKEKDFKLEVPGDSLAFTLKGKAEKEESFIMDGNEEVSEVVKQAGGGWERATVGTIEIPESGPFQLHLRQGQEFEFHATIGEFKKQDPIYRSMRLDVKAIILTPAIEQTEAGSVRTHYEATWESLAKAPVPKWWDDGKFGIFIHWGPYSVAGYKDRNRGYAEAITHDLYKRPERYVEFMTAKFGAAPPAFGYKDMVPLFRAEKWDPAAWARLFKESGATYVIPTGEHHDGFVLWDSKLTPWTATRKGPFRNLIGDLGQAVRAEGLKYGVSYHRERHPNRFTPDAIVRAKPFEQVAEEINRMPESASLYGPFDYSDEFIADYVARWKEVELQVQPDFVWIDDVPILYNAAGDPQVKKFEQALQGMIADYLNQSQTRGKEVYFNNKGKTLNWPKGVGCREADNLQMETIGPRWQNPATLGTSYAYMAAEEEHDLYKTPSELIRLLCDVVSKNGNLLLNIGPKADGTIPEGIQRRLLAMGAWLKVNGEAIYGSNPWKVYGEYEGEIINEEGVHYTNHSMRIHETEYRYTAKPGTVYAIAFQQADTPVQLKAFAGFDKKITAVSMLGSDSPIEWSLDANGLKLTTKDEVKFNHAAVFKVVHE